MSEQTIKIRTRCSLGRESNVDDHDTGITASEWEAMLDEERKEIIDDYQDTMIQNYLDSTAYVISEEEFNNG